LFFYEFNPQVELIMTSSTYSRKIADPMLSLSELDALSQYPKEVD